MRTFGQLDFEELTTIPSRITELPPRRKPEGNIRDDSYLDEDDGSYAGDGSNPSLPGVTTTEYYTESGPVVEREENNEISDDDENDDDDDCYSDDDGYESEDGGGDDDDDDDDDDDIDDDDDDDDDDGDDDDDETKAENPKVNYEGKRRMDGKKSKQHVTSAETFETLKKSTNFEDSVEHGRQRKEDDSEDFPASGTRKIGEGSTLTITDTPRSALERDLATFLKNESPEAEDQETRNVTKRIRKENDDRNTKKNREPVDANSYAVRNLQELRELEKKTNIPQKVKYFHFTVIFMHSLISQCTVSIKSSIGYCLSSCVLQRPRHVSVLQNHHQGIRFTEKNLHSSYM
jgi:hypothetical protein